MNLAYSYDLGGGVNNGNVVALTNNKDTTRSESFTYDTLNRVSTAQTSGSTGSFCWGQSFGYDRFGNLLTATVTKCSAPALNLTVNGNNQITNTGFQYDAAGNMTNDGNHAYTFDAENRLTSGNSVTYTHDGDNWRVKKSNGDLEWHDTSCGGDLVDVFDLSGNLKSEYYYLGSILIATRSFFYYGDQLQSERVMTDTTGHVQWESDYYAYGGELNVTNLATNDRKFNSKRRDTETGFDYAHARMLDSTLGRWNSADQLGGQTEEPQSLNKYSYVSDEPVGFIDPAGTKRHRPFEYSHRSQHHRRRKRRTLPTRTAFDPVVRANPLASFEAPDCSKFKACMEAADTVLVVCIAACTLDGPLEPICVFGCTFEFLAHASECSREFPGCASVGIGGGTGASNTGVGPGGSGVPGLFGPGGGFGQTGASLQNDLSAANGGWGDSSFTGGVQRK